MTDKEKALDRFGFTSPDKCIRTSQCVGCVHNEGKKCKAYGDKPMQYARVTEGNICPKRKIA